MIQIKKIRTSVLSLSVLFFSTGNSLADGIVVDKIYHPYVLPFEQEMEWRTIYQDEQALIADNTWLSRLAYGRSLSERWFAEIYLIGKKSDDQGFKIQAYEVEALWQLTEQGEFSADWGILFELEKEARKDKWEVAAAVLIEKEWRKWSGTANFFVSGQWGSDANNELDTKLNLQARYRYSQAFEPAIEFYNGQDTRGIGPVFLGQIKMAGGRQVKWELGAIFGLTDESPNQTLRLLLEFEF